MNIESFFLRILRRLGLIKFPDVVPPSYETKRKIISDFLSRYKIQTAIETGTFLGDTTAFLAERCASVYSIELAEDLAKKATERFSEVPNVTIIQGDSTLHIPRLLESTPGSKLFWLDGHYSGTCFQGESTLVTARGSSDTPIVAELKSILNDSIPHVILVDDARLFTGISDYPSIRKVAQLCRSNPHRYTLTIEDDIIRILSSVQA
jgi:hypothetical protein